MGVRSVLALGLIARLSAPLLLPHRRGALPGACQWSGRVSRGTSPFVVSRSLATDVVEDAESEQESSGEVKDAAEWDTLLCALEACVARRPSRVASRRVASVGASVDRRSLRRS